MNTASFLKGESTAKVPSNFLEGHILIYIYYRQWLFLRDHKVHAYG